MLQFLKCPLEATHLTILTSQIFFYGVFIFYSAQVSVFFTLRLSVGSFCLNRMSQTSRTPSIFTVKKTEGRTGLQQASLRYDI